jgi:hypothetical protein
MISRCSSRSHELYLPASWDKVEMRVYRQSLLLLYQVGILQTQRHHEQDIKAFSSVAGFTQELEEGTSRFYSAWNSCADSCLSAVVLQHSSPPKFRPFLVAIFESSRRLQERHGTFRRAPSRIWYIVFMTLCEKLYQNEYVISRQLPNKNRARSSPSSASCCPVHV